MSRPPAHLHRLSIQQAHNKLKQRNTSHAIPTDYRDVEMSERMTLQAFLGDSRGKPYATGEHWNHLAACRNVLLFGAGHMREQVIFWRSAITPRNPCLPFGAVSRRPGNLGSVVTTAFTWRSSLMRLPSSGKDSPHGSSGTA